MKRFYVFLLVLCTLAISQVYALSSSEVQISRVTGPAFNNQQGTTTLTGPGPHAAYVGFKVKNISGAPLYNLLADVYLFTTTPNLAGNGGLGLAGGQSRYQYIGRLGVNDSAVIFYYISYPVTNNISCNINIKITDNLPGFASYCAVVKTRSLTVLGGNTPATYNGHIDASACSVTANPVVGGIQKVTVKYDFSNVSSGHEINLQPAGNVSFNAGALQLVSAVVDTSTIPGINSGGTAGVDSLGNPVINYLEQMYYLASGPAATGYVVIDYYFQCQVPNTSTVMQPYGVQTNGSVIRYTENYGQPSTVFNLQTTDFPFSIVKTASQAVAAASAIIDYTITITNTSTYTASFHQLMDTLPTGCTYLGMLGTSDITAANSEEYPAASSMGYIFWSGLKSATPYPYRTYNVAPGASVSLGYQIQLPSNLGLNKYFLNKTYIIAGATKSDVATAGTCVSCLDQDNDDVFDMADKDDDNDGIEDYSEICGLCYGTDPLGDDDNDFIINYLDVNIQGFVDANGDGVHDKWDFDGDGIINTLDLDSDGDGIADIVEASGTDNDANGQVDDLPISLNDHDNDGVVNIYDADFATTGIRVHDTDRDGQYDFLDLDSDGDGVADICEVGGCLLDADGDGKIDATLLSSVLPNDNNPDGLCTCASGVSVLVATTDLDFDGIPDVYTNDIDADNRPNFMDIDSDGDGIVDVLEFQPTDANYNISQVLFPDAFENLILPTSNVDVNDDGILDAYPVGQSRIIPIDTDSDGIPDYLDTNSDDNLPGGDSYSDFIEGNDLDHNHIIDAVGEPLLVSYSPNDTDEDGLDDVFDSFDVNSIPDFWDNARGTSSPIAPANQFGTVPVFRTTNNVFPVTLVSFDGKFVNNQVALTWKTASELNCDKFEVERSIDNQNFEKIGERAAKNGTQANTYDLIDNKPLVNEGYVLYYRLKMIDKDGAFTRSNVVSVNVSTNSSVLLSVYPNPVSDKLQISYFLKEAAEAKITVRDIAGRTVQTLDVSTANLWQNFEMEVKDWNTGIYFISINDGLSSQVVKVVVE